jgi:hypothetical protein
MSLKREPELVGDTVLTKQKCRTRTFIVVIVLVLVASAFLLWWDHPLRKTQIRQESIVKSTPILLDHDLSRFHALNSHHASPTNQGVEMGTTPVSTPTTLGEPVTVELARKVAEAFLEGEKRRSAQLGTNTTNLRDFTVGQTEAVRQNTGPPLAYVHNLRPAGFIITSANTGMRPVVSFSFKGFFSFQDSADNVLLHLLRADMTARSKALSGGSAEAAVQSNVIQWTQYEL